MKYKGFSLIELLVVITIVGLIAAIAVPGYKAYQARAIVAEKVNNSFFLLNEAVLKYQANGSYPSSITIGNDVIDANTHWQVVGSNEMGISGFLYSVNTTTNTIQLQISFNDLDVIPGFEATVGNPAGVGRSVLSVAARDIGNGAIEKVCGPTPYLDQDIPFEYLPSTCSCGSVDSFASSGQC